METIYEPSRHTMRIVITYQHRGDDTYLRTIDLAFASAKRLGYETVLVGNVIAGDKQIDFPADKEAHLMNWVLAAQRAFIDSPLFDCDSVIFSPDALLTRHIDKVFTLGFDIGFTIRNNRRWPINNGVIYLRPGRKREIAKLWHRAQKICKDYPVETQDWYGDQQALHDVWLAGHHERLHLNVSMLPCDIYNASPAYGEDLDAKMIESAYIVHLKGRRKHLMQEYWDKICSA